VRFVYFNFCKGEAPLERYRRGATGDFLAKGVSVHREQLALGGAESREVPPRACGKEDEIRVANFGKKKEELNAWGRKEKKEK